MESFVASLTMDEIIDFHSCATILLNHQITESAEDWLLVLEKKIGLERIYKWSVFVNTVIGEEFTEESFQKKSRILSKLLQKRFADIGLDISMWGPVFFYLGMIFTYAKHIGFVRITHNMSSDRIRVLERLDPNFRDAITPDLASNYLFIESRRENPLEITDYLIRSGLLIIEKIDIFTTQSIQLPFSFDEIPQVILHIPDELVSEIELSDFKGLYCTY